jgi:membrane associated rhomboid family serine protease
MSDDTEIGIEAITEDIEDPQKRRAVARILRRNSMVAKILIWVTITILSGVLAAIGAHFGGLINAVD